MRLIDIDTLKAVPVARMEGRLSGEKAKSCRFCLNARVDDELTDYNDFSSFSVGYSANKYRTMISAGDGRPVRIETEKWDGDHWSLVMRYYPKYCPECGRKLDEYEEAKPHDD